MLSSHHQGNDKFNKFGSTTDMTSVTQVKTKVLWVPSEYLTLKILMILPKLQIWFSYLSINTGNKTCYNSGTRHGIQDATWFPNRF